MSKQLPRPEFTLAGYTAWLFLDGVEGDHYAEPPKIDQPTGRGGITLPVLKEFFAAKHLGVASKNTLMNLDRGLAEQVVSWYNERNLEASGLNGIPERFPALKFQMLDFSYNSGTRRAVRWLQRVLFHAGSPAATEITGVIDYTTLAALKSADLWLVHQALIAARLQMVERTPGLQKYEEGLENRILAFSLIEV